MILATVGACLAALYVCYKINNTTVLSMATSIRFQTVCRSVHGLVVRRRGTMELWRHAPSRAAGSLHNRQPSDRIAQLAPTVRPSRLGHVHTQTVIVTDFYELTSNARHKRHRVRKAMQLNCCDI